MKQKYSLQKYVIYNSMCSNLFESTSAIFLVNYFNTILYFRPHHIKVLLKNIQYDIIEYNSKHNANIDEYKIYDLLLMNLDINHKFYKKYKIILENNIYNTLQNYKLVSKNNTFLNIINFLCI